MHQDNPSFARRSFLSRPALAVLLAALAAVPLAGCGGSTSSTTESAPAAAAEADTAAKAKAHPRSFADGALGLALEQPGLRADQKQKIEALRAELAGASTGVRAARVAIAEKVAEQIKAGAIDRGALAPLLETAERASEGSRPAEQKALNGLHAVLDAKQRQALVDAAFAKIGSLRDHKGEAHERLEQLADELELSDTQRRAIKDKARAGFLHGLAEHHAEHGKHEARMKELGAAFASADFDATKLDVGKEGSPMAKRMADGMIGLVEAALPELTAAQRIKLADHVVAHARDGAGH